ncbi:hypothetical protein [Paraburkholderia solisilvae]|uniref:Uncharacterized protein n=1 Tax=Paraburkholderia solisilvae TaxID=624376 RepID=A0A6J5E222_9BURK|nr:hypothetical protein [Paraburkholderia solisilvae]CAB3760499.1 hypothetical protein LMG29739_03407 [Paraburkholderia solisilvae]
MEVHRSIALRARLVLFSMSMVLAIFFCFGTDWLAGLADERAPRWILQCATLTMAAALIAVAQRYARRAFESATVARKVQVLWQASESAAIAKDCPRAWLVQLHLELQGLRCDEVFTPEI